MGSREPPVPFLDTLPALPAYDAGAEVPRIGLALQS